MRINIDLTYMCQDGKEVCNMERFYSCWGHDMLSETSAKHLWLVVGRAQKLLIRQIYCTICKQNTLRHKAYTRSKRLQKSLRRRRLKPHLLSDVSCLEFSVMLCLGYQWLVFRMYPSKNGEFIALDCQPLIKNTLIQHIYIIF